LEFYLAHEFEQIDSRAVDRLPSPEERASARSKRVRRIEMGKVVEGAIWICGVILVLGIVFYSVGGFDMLALLYSKIMNPPPTTVAPSAPSPSG